VIRLFVDYVVPVVLVTAGAAWLALELVTLHKEGRSW